jgi:hypothetical protein
MERLNLQFPDAELRDLAPQLLPAEMRDGLR